MSGASKMSRGIPQGNSEIGNGIRQVGDKAYEGLHQDAIHEMEQTGDFGYLTSPWQALKIGGAEVMDKFTGGGDMNASQRRDQWFDQEMKRAKTDWLKMQLKGKQQP